jgi:hypothetical protein
MYRSDVLWEAWKRVKQNNGAPGVDGQIIEYLEEVIGVVPFLRELQKELHTQEYEPEPVLRHWIPKPGSTDKRPVGLPIVKDRVAQAAAKLVLEPIFEAHFLSFSYGFRPGRSAHDAIDRIRRSITFERQEVEEVLIPKYTRGAKRKANREHLRLRQKACVERKKGNYRAAKRLLKIYGQLPSQQYEDPE